MLFASHILLLALEFLYGKISPAFNMLWFGLCFWRPCPHAISQTRAVRGPKDALGRDYAPCAAGPPASLCHPQHLEWLQMDAGQAGGPNPAPFLCSPPFFICCHQLAPGATTPPAPPKVHPCHKLLYFCKSHHF